MQFVSAFQHSVYLELAIIDLEQKGVPKENIWAFPLDKAGTNVPAGQRSHAVGTTSVDLAFILGMVGMLLGAIYGFVLTWGPIIWGLIGMVAGAVIGLLIKLLFSGTKVLKQAIKVDVILIVDCTESQEQTVEQILWSHQALGVAKTPPS